MTALRRGRLGRALLALLSAGVISAACAQGGTVDESGSGGASSASGTGGSGGGIPAGQIGGACETTDDCPEGAECTQVGNQKVCTVPCPPDCPVGTYCALIEGDSICVPDLDQQCLPCQGAVDCKQPSDQCLEAPLGDKFCARDCTTANDCPNGFECMDAKEYAAIGSNGGPPDAGVADAGGSDAGAGDAGAGDAGVSDAGAGDAGAKDAGAGAKDAGMDAGGSKPPSGMPYKFCVPKNGLSCPCNKKRDGVQHACEQSNLFGTCKGKETCNGATGKWEGCTAKKPKGEACNGEDDDCDDVVDEGQGSELCAGEGGPPTHASWACEKGKCVRGECDPGWAAFPPGAANDGCTCPVEVSEDNGTCATAASGGTVTDTGGEVLLEGTLSSNDDADWWLVETVDTAEASTNSYHVSIAFVAPAQSSEFVMDVVRGQDCVDVPSGPATSITSYTWCVDGTAPSGTQGEKVCGPQAAVHCNDNSSSYWIRVRRKPGAKATCTAYTIKVTAGGSGEECDFSKKCE